MTVIRNFIDVTDTLRRDPQHVLQFLLRELGTPGNIEGRRVVLKSKVSPGQIIDVGHEILIRGYAVRPAIWVDTEGTGELMLNK